MDLFFFFHENCLCISLRMQQTKVSLRPFSGSEKVQVCETFFLPTLSIGDQMIKTALKKQVVPGVSSHDKRSKHDSRPDKNTECKKKKKCDSILRALQLLKVIIVGKSPLKNTYLLL